jgi:hypothetical protein
MLIFISILVIGVFIMTKFENYISIFGILAPQGIYEYLQLSVLFISLSLAYIATYSALELDSPSLVMVMSIAKLGSRGLSTQDLIAEMSDDILILPRLKGLILEKLVYLKDNKYKLSAKGLIIVQIFILYRKILGISQKGG